MHSKSARFFAPVVGLIVCLGLWRVGVAVAQDPPAAPPAGHSMHGEAFNEGPRQKAYLMGGTGKVHFPITTQVPDAQAFFNQGVGQLHGFWYFEAERSFRQVAALDPDCAMAYWGMAMANVNNEKRAKELIKKATALKDKADRREQMWISALAEYYSDEKKERKQRRRQLVRAIETIVQEFPDDLEAKAFLVVQIWSNNGDIPIGSTQAVYALCEQVLAVEPMHPLHHYVIHIWNGEKDQRAIKSADLCGKSAPSIAHMWHMSGHTYSSLRRYADAAWEQEAASRVDHAQMIRDRVLPDQIHNYAHNEEWLCRDLSHIGRARDAVDLAKNLIELPRHPKYNTLSKGSSSSSYGRLRLYELLYRFELWHELIACTDSMYLEATDVFDEQVKRLRARGVAFFAIKDAEKGREQIRALDDLLQKERAARIAAADAAEAAAKKENKPADQIAKAMADALQGHAKKIQSLETALSELKGYDELAKANHEAAKPLFEEAKDLSKERRAQILVELGDKEKAEQLAREAAESAQDQVQPLANYVDILHRVGKVDEAQKQLEKLRATAGHADLDLPVFGRLRPLAQSMNLPDDWRQPVTLAADRSERPKLDELGPFRWHASPAAPWNLPDADGKTISLADFRGKPVVVIFYLGAGCVHCVEQLNAFSPMATQFADAGISMLAISTETQEGLKASLAKLSSSEQFPIQLVSDDSLRVFKEYRCFDDFEKTPLHGTFLIDGDALVRWQDISYEPFRDAAFLLNESKRLLSQPRGRVAPGEHVSQTHERKPAE